MNRQLQILKAKLMERGLKLTAQREKIAREIFRTHKHLTAEELYERMRRKHCPVSLTTVYRTLKLLCNCGMLRELRLQDNRSRYEHTYLHGHHDHLICLKCGHIMEFDNPDLEELQREVAQENGFTVVDYSLQLFGFCRDCISKGET